MKPLKIAMLGLRAIGQDLGANPDLANLFSGVETAVEEISTRLAARGHEVTVFCRDRFNPKGADNFKSVHLVNKPAIYTKHLEAITHTFLASLSSARGYDIVHYHATGPTLMAFIPRMAGRKTVATVHGLDWQRQKWGMIAKCVLKSGAWAAGHFPHRTIVVSRELHSFYNDRYGRETAYIPNGVSPAEYTPLEQLKRYNLEQKKYILYLGRLVPEKGCHLLIEAFKKTDADHKLLIAGGSSYTSEYVEGLKKSAKDDRRIVFAGALYGKDKSEAFSNASFLVMPSSLEGMPIVMLEAMSYGCPVLCSDIPVHKDVTSIPDTDKLIAQIFELDRPESLTEKLKYCMHNLQPLQDLADKAKDHVLKEYSWDGITEQTEEVYKTVLGS